MATPTKIDDDTFEELLRRAVIEFTNWEAERVPPKEEIEKTYTMSARHKERMEKISFCEFRGAKAPFSIASERYGLV